MNSGDGRVDTVVQSYCSKVGEVFDSLISLDKILLCLSSYDEPTV